MMNSHLLSQWKPLIRFLFSCTKLGTRIIWSFCRCELTALMKAPVGYSDYYLCPSLPGVEIDHELYLADSAFLSYLAY
mgnify:CR=1 FL=1